MNKNTEMTMQQKTQFEYSDEGVSEFIPVNTLEEAVEWGNKFNLETADECYDARNGFDVDFTINVYVDGDQVESQLFSVWIPPDHESLIYVACGCDLSHECCNCDHDWINKSEWEHIVSPDEIDDRSDENGNFGRGEQTNTRFYVCSLCRLRLMEIDIENGTLCPDEERRVVYYPPVEKE